MTDPINLSIGQPDFDVPEPMQEAAIERDPRGQERLSPTQGMAALRDKLQRARSQRSTGTPTRQVFVTSGTSGGLVLAMLALVNPGDEVIVFDPYFVMYKSLVGLVGGKCVLIDTYPDFRIDLDKVAAAITPRTKAILFNSPANPTGRAGQRGRDARAGRNWPPSGTSRWSATKSTATSATTSRSSRPPRSTRRRS